jgi:NADH:ubiquinone oxidoreductase subunit K
LQSFNRKNVFLIGVEIMFLGINLVFISGYIFLQLEIGLVYALISLSIAAAEAGIGFGNNCVVQKFTRHLSPRI